MSLAIANLLLEFGVYTQSTNIRLARAAALAKAGVTEDDVRIVAAHIEATCDEGKLPPFLGAVVNTPERFVEMAADVRHYLVKREERKRVREAEAACPNATHPANLPRPWPTCYCQDCWLLVRSGKPWPAIVTADLVRAGKDKQACALAEPPTTRLRRVE